MKSTVVWILCLVVVIGENFVEGRDYFDLLNEIGYDNNRQRSVPGNSRNNVTIVRPKSKLSAKRTQSANVGLNFLDPDPVAVGHEVNCRGISGQIHATGRQSMCKPRKTLVKLTPDPGYMYVPEVVLVDRCNGMCGHHSQSCMKIESTMKKVHVMRMQRGARKAGCYELEVEEHTRCKCDCDLMADDCNRMQSYVHDECKCKCNNFEQQNACELDETMEWDQDMCRCNCRVEEICNTGLVWVPSMCKCAKVLE